MTGQDKTFFIMRLLYYLIKISYFTFFVALA